MRLERLAGIHHDSSCIVVSGSESTVIIDSGTSWYQSNLVERLNPHLEGRAPLAAILLTHRHFDSCGAAPHLAQYFDTKIKVHEDAVAPLAGGDLFTTWASRYDSDMPPIDAEGFSEGEEISLGDVTLSVLHTPGHTMDARCFHIQEKDAVICGDLVPAAGHPSRADMPTGNLIQMKEPGEGPEIVSKTLGLWERGSHLRFGCLRRGSQETHRIGRPPNRERRKIAERLAQAGRNLPLVDARTPMVIPMN